MHEPLDREMVARIFYAALGFEDDDAWDKAVRRREALEMTDLHTRHQRMCLAGADLIMPLIAADRAALAERVEALEKTLNTPELDDFATGVVSEAQHQRVRWGAEHDAGKTPLDWFWLIGYLAQKAATAHQAGAADKAKHHTVSTAAALANWHAAVAGDSTSMRPGIIPPALSLSNTTGGGDAPARVWDDESRSFVQPRSDR